MTMTALNRAILLFATGGAASAQADGSTSAVSSAQIAEISSSVSSGQATTGKAVDSAVQSAVSVGDSAPGSAHLLPVLLIAALFVALVCIALLLRRLRAMEQEAKTPSMPVSPPKPGPIRRFRVGKLHEQGKREYQQDAFGLSDESIPDQHGQLAVVADGMGGLAESDRVSVAAVETILDQFALSQGRIEPRALLLQIAADARQVVNGMLGSGSLGKSGSTLSMALIRDEKLFFLNVGDSRICLLRDGALLQLNRENVYENELCLRAVNGQCEVQDAFTDPQRGGLTSFLGMGQLQGVDFPAAPVQLRAGDKVILMTDGVYNALDEETLVSVLMEEPETAAERLREEIEARAYSNQDNYTAVILECMSDEA